MPFYRFGNLMQGDHVTNLPHMAEIQTQLLLKPDYSHPHLFLHDACIKIHSLEYTFSSTTQIRLKQNQTKMVFGVFYLSLAFFFFF